MSINIYISQIIKWKYGFSNPNSFCNTDLKQYIIIQNIEEKFPGGKIFFYNPILLKKANIKCKNFRVE